MDALEAGSKATTEPRKRKRSAKDSPSDATSAPPAKVQEPPAQPAVSSANSEPAVAVSPVPVKPMFNVMTMTIFCLQYRVLNYDNHLIIQLIQIMIFRKFYL